MAQQARPAQVGPQVPPVSLALGSVARRVLRGLLARLAPPVRPVRELRVLRVQRVSAGLLAPSVCQALQVQRESQVQQESQGPQVPPESAVPPALPAQLALAGLRAFPELLDQQACLARQEQQDSELLAATDALGVTDIPALLVSQVRPVLPAYRGQPVPLELLESLARRERSVLPASAGRPVLPESPEQRARPVYQEQRVHLEFRVQLDQRVSLAQLVQQVSAVRQELSVSLARLVPAAYRAQLESVALPALADPSESQGPPAQRG